MSSLLITQFWILCDHLGHLKTLGDFGRLLGTLRPERQKVLRAEQGPCDTINANPTSTLAYIWTKGLDKQGVQYIFIAIYNRDGRQVNHNTIILGCTALTQCSVLLNFIGSNRRHIFRVSYRFVFALKPWSGAVYFHRSIIFLFSRAFQMQCSESRALSLINKESSSLVSFKFWDSVFLHLAA